MAILHTFRLRLKAFGQPSQAQVGRLTMNSLHNHALYGFSEEGRQLQVESCQVVTGQPALCCRFTRLHVPGFDVQPLISAVFVTEPAAAPGAATASLLHTLASSLEAPKKRLGRQRHGENGTRKRFPKVEITHPAARHLSRAHASALRQLPPPFPPCASFKPSQTRRVCTPAP